MGRIAAQNLMKTETPIGKMRGQRYQYADTGIPVVVTYHPAYLLRSPREKRKAWQDLQLAMLIYKETALALSSNRQPLFFVPCQKWIWSK